MKMNFIGYRSCHDLTNTVSAWLGPHIPTSTLGKVYETPTPLRASTFPPAPAVSCQIFPARALHSGDILMSIFRRKLALDFTSPVKLTQMYSCGKNNNGKAA